MSESILAVVFDSLRFDVAYNADVPWRFEEAISAAHWTRPSFVNFHLGFGSVPIRRCFDRKAARWMLPEELRLKQSRITANMMNVLRRAGYHTLLASSISHAHLHSERFHQALSHDGNPTIGWGYSPHQADWLRSRIPADGRPTFVLWHIGETHVPFRNCLRPRTPDHFGEIVDFWVNYWAHDGDVPKRIIRLTFQAMRESLEFIAPYVQTVIDAMPPSTRVVLTADHGFTVGEGGCYGHAIAHPACYQVPWSEFRTNDSH